MNDNDKLKTAFIRVPVQCAVVLELLVDGVA